MAHQAHLATRLVIYLYRVGYTNIKEFWYIWLDWVDHNRIAVTLDEARSTMLDKMTPDELSGYGHCFLGVTQVYFSCICTT